MLPSAIKPSEVLLVFKTLLPMDVKVLVPKMETHVPRGKARVLLNFKLLGCTQSLHSPCAKRQEGKTSCLYPGRSG